MSVAKGDNYSWRKGVQMWGSKKIFILIVFLLGLFQSLLATRLEELSVVDQDYLMLRFEDGDVRFVDDGLGESAYGSHTESDNSYAVYYGQALDVTNTAEVSNWIIKSGDDSNYGETGLNPRACFRKSRINGMSQEEWGSNDWNFDYTKEHFFSESPATQV